jgi:hypothetical protein
MFKQFFVDLVNVNSAVSLQWLAAGMRGPKLNTMTVLIYHKLFGTGKYEAGTREMKRI